MVLLLFNNKNSFVLVIKGFTIGTTLVASYISQRISDARKQISDKPKYLIGNE